MSILKAHGFDLFFYELRDDYEECVVEDLMTRYAAGHKGDEDQILEAMRVDSMKRAIALFRNQQVRERNRHRKVRQRNADSSHRWAVDEPKARTLSRGMWAPVAAYRTSVEAGVYEHVSARVYVGIPECM